jgi:valine--pyruvate aminotransferase
MKDIAGALLSEPSKEWLNLSPGNPLVLPEVEAMWRDYAQEIIDSPDFGACIGRYGMTQGYEPFIDAVVETYNKLYNWGITRKNVLITAGSQPLYFFCVNSFGGVELGTNSLRKIVIPLVPDYTGYDGVVLDSRQIQSFRPQMDIIGPHEFKYRVDFDALNIDSSTGAILCSRPCNPTGNILTDAETSTLLDYAKRWDIPLLIDSAYAPPFPNLAYVPMNPLFDEHIIHCVSLSKAGLPGERVGIAIGHERYIQALEPFQSNVGVHSSRFGQALATKAFLSGKLTQLAQTVIKPFYQQKLSLFREALHQHLPNDVPWYLHRVEGSLFSWLWIDSDRVDDFDMYKRLKARGLLCVPGSTFFPGLHEEWSHKHRCMRFSMTAPDEHLVKAAQVLAAEIRETPRE